MRVIAAVGVVMVALITRKTLGGVGEMLELVSIKSLGVLVLVFISRPHRRA